MNKLAARKAVESGRVTFNDLRVAIMTTRGCGGMSALNAALTKEQGLDILERGIQGRLDAELVQPFRFDAVRRRDIRTRDSIIAENILRESAWRAFPEDPK